MKVYDNVEVQVEKVEGIREKENSKDILVIVQNIKEEKDLEIIIDGNNFNSEHFNV